MHIIRRIVSQMANDFAGAILANVFFFTLAENKSCKFFRFELGTSWVLYLVWNPKQRRQKYLKANIHRFTKILSMFYRNETSFL